MTGETRIGSTHSTEAAFDLSSNHGLTKPPHWSHHGKLPRFTKKLLSTTLFCLARKKLANRPKSCCVGLVVKTEPWLVDRATATSMQLGTGLTTSMEAECGFAATLADLTSDPSVNCPMKRRIESFHNILINMCLNLSHSSPLHQCSRDIDSFTQNS